MEFSQANDSIDNVLNSSKISSINDDLNKENLNHDNMSISKGSVKRKDLNSSSLRKESSFSESKEFVSSSHLSKSKSSITFRELIDLLVKIEKYKGANAKDCLKEILSEFFIEIIENYRQDLSKIYYFLSYKLLN